MLKKFICIVMMIAIMASAVGCRAGAYQEGQRARTKEDMYAELYGEPEETQQESGPSLKEKQEEASKAEKYGETSTEVRLNPQPLEVPDRRIIMNVPNYMENVEESSYVYSIADDRFVSFVIDKEDTASTPAEAFDVCAQKFYPDIQNYNAAFGINIANETEDVAHGIPIYVFEGTLSSMTKKGDKEYNPYCYGISFIMDDTPCLIIGAVINRSQKDGAKAEIHDTIIEMINTLRNA